jgi:hypothetical protein
MQALCCAVPTNSCSRCLYRSIPIAKPTVAKIAPACAPSESAPEPVVVVFVDALGDAAPDPAVPVPEPVPVVPDADVPVLVVFDVPVVPPVVVVRVALAAVWNAAKDLSAVGFTAKTMPMPQCETGAV